jgi:hypothetical protein
VLAVCFVAEAAREPIRSQSRHLAQSPALRKQMGLSLDDRQMFFSFEIFIDLPIQCSWSRDNSPMPSATKSNFSISGRKS